MTDCARWWKKRRQIWVYIVKHGGEGNGTPLQYSCLENPMDGGAWWAAVHGVTKSWTQLSDFTFTFHFQALEEVATHSSILAWRVPGTVEPGGLPSMGSHRVGHDWSDLAAAAAAYFSPWAIHWQLHCRDIINVKHASTFLDSFAVFLISLLMMHPTDKAPDTKS